MNLAGFKEIPPVSKQTPLPTKARGLDLSFKPFHSIVTRYDPLILPCPTPRSVFIPNCFNFLSSKIFIFRPSFLIGTGGRHRAFSEKIFMRLAKVMDIFCIRSARKYRSINSEILAKKMVSTLNADPGIHYYYFDDFIN